jgi:phosphatidylglycerol:prolipoprotein diacylglycerol transferase
MMATGFLAAYMVTAHRAKRTGFPPEYVADSLILAVIGGLIGARILYLISYWGEYVKVCEENGKNPYLRVLFVHEGGMVFLGGFFGAALAIFIMARIRKIEASKIADFAAMGVPIGHTFGRIGCYMTGCCYGMPYKGIGAISYPISHYGTIAERHAKTDLITYGDVLCHPVFPSQLVASASNFLIFTVILLLMKFRVCKKSGQLFGVYLMLYAVSRFGNELLRGDSDQKHRHFTWLWSRGFTDAQTLTPLIFLSGVAVFFLMKRYSPDAPIAQSPVTVDEVPNGE